MLEHSSFFFFCLWGMVLIINKAKLFNFFLQAGECQKKESNSTSDDDSGEKAELNAQQAFVFGQNLRDRVKVSTYSLP